MNKTETEQMILSLLTSFDEQWRAEVLRKITDRWCTSCGKNQNDLGCYCDYTTPLED